MLDEDDILAIAAAVTEEIGDITAAATTGFLAATLPHGGTVGQALQAALAMACGRMVIDTTAKTMTLYAPNGTTVLVIHDLSPTAGAATTRTPQ